jgi:ABC-type lipoprotein export system ATPase subunit
MIRLEQISKEYRSDSGRVSALENINIKVNEGEFVVIRGPSGSGKSTLLLTMGGMLHPSKGEVFIDDQNIYMLSNKNRAKFRAEKIGFVFQMFHLLPYLDCFDNILLPGGLNRRESLNDDVTSLVHRLGLTKRIDHKPSELSIGERQRTAIARALLNNPKIILADEPTGNLDPENATEVIGYLSEFHKNKGTVILVTHGNKADQYADRIVYLKDGCLVAS